MIHLKEFVRAFRGTKHGDDGGIFAWVWAIRNLFYRQRGLYHNAPKVFQNQVGVWVICKFRLKVWLHGTAVKPRQSSVPYEVSLSSKEPDPLRTPVFGSSFLSSFMIGHSTVCLIVRLWFWHIKPPNLKKMVPVVITHNMMLADDSALYKILGNKKHFLKWITWFALCTVLGTREIFFDWNGPNVFGEKNSVIFDEWGGFYLSLCLSHKGKSKPFKAPFIEPTSVTELSTFAVLSA